MSIRGFGVSNFSVLKASLPVNYIAVKIKPGRHTDATRYEIYRGGAHDMANYIGDIVYLALDDIWVSQPRSCRTKDFKFAVNAVNHLCNVERFITILASENTPPF
jgi:hypothetical protein